jgi:uncharacterized protein with GYD domain
MLFIGLVKWRKKPTQAMLAQTMKILEDLKKEGGKTLGVYWTLGRYDAVVIIEAKDEKTAMKYAIQFADTSPMEILIGVPREEAIKLLA